jgi:pimeloyl-ACP methyl ester carboxylesterase
VRGRVRWALLAIALMGAAATGALVIGSSPPMLETTGLEAVPCWSSEAGGVSVRCFYLTVPESRERPNDRAIRIAVAILAPAGTAARPLPDPLVHLAGGPGAGTGLSGELFAFWLNWYRQWPGARGRALILVDQRGTGKSEPELICDRETSAEAMRVYYGASHPRDPLENAEWRRRYLLDCRAPFDEAGIQVAAYNTAESAADFVALRHALGIVQWDVWGVSYGTELALELLRIDEAGIRSVILDSVSLYGRPDVVPGNMAAAFDRALTQVYRTCLLDEACSAAFPGLSTRLGKGLAWLRLQPQPLTLSGGYARDGMEFELDERLAVKLLFTALYAPEFVPGVPATLSAFAQRDFRLAEHLANYMMATPTLLPLAEVMQTSTICRAAPRREALRQLHDQESRYPNYSILWLAELYHAVCPAWQAPAADPAELLPVRSDVPALILGGRYDPITPPEWGRIVATWLPNSTVIEFPHLAHGSVSLDPCADRIAARFLRWPDEDPHDACYAELAPPLFLLPGRVPTD